jgi:uncharacterized protein YkwD
MSRTIVRRATLARLGAALLLVACSPTTPPAPEPAPRSAPTRTPARTPARPPSRAPAREPSRDPAASRPRRGPTDTPARAAPSTVEEGGPLIEGLTRLETDVLRETNRARQDPRAYADLLERQLAYYDGLLLKVPGQNPIRTEEGARAVREAIRVLRGLTPIAPLGYAPGLSLAARDHVRDQGRRGATGHKGTDGSSMSDRVSRHGRWDVSLSENIAYGPATGRDVVVGLIVDDGVPDRGHRLTIFDATLRLAGVACGEHRTYRVMCVVNYAARFEDRRTAAR